MDCAPHFEKTLYDNSQLARVYLHAWILNSARSLAVTGNVFFRTITEEILDYVAGSGRRDQQKTAETYRLVAERNAEFLLRALREGNGRLLLTWKAYPERVKGAGEAKLNGYLEDYAYLIEGLLELSQTTFDPRWFVAAQELAETMLERFADSDGTQYDTSDDHEALITRTRDLQDNAKLSALADSLRQ